MERAFGTLALLYTSFERVNGELAKVDKEFDKECSRMLHEMEKVKDVQRCVDESALCQSMPAARITTMWHRTRGFGVSTN